MAKNFCITLVTGALAAFSAVAASPSIEQVPKPAHSGINLSGMHGFDFLAGEWRVRHRRISAVTRQWVEFEGTCTLRLIMNGAANIEEHVLDSPDGAYRAIGLRSFDEKTGLWSIWWLDGRYPGRPLDPPAKGRFVGGVGTFNGQDTVHGKPVPVRFTGSDITTDSARWQQGYSYDGGKTWETNWIAEFRRLER